MFVVGIDEAGRGPVIGPLVVAGVKIKEEDNERLSNIGVKDSKLLSELQRERLYDQIIDIVESYKIVELSPKEIDEVLLSPSSNLNWLEGDVAAEIINELSSETAYVDCPSNNIKAFSDYLKKKVDQNTNIVCEHKADTKFPSVAAASILAKVTRDKRVREIKKDIGIDFGSGYPSDPITQVFLEKNYKRFPEIFRKTWQSYKKIVTKNTQSTLSGFE